MAKKYSKKWKENISKGKKKYWEKLKEKGLSEETRKKLSEAGKKGNLIRIYKRLDIEDLKSFTKIRERLFEERGKKCEKCGWKEVNKFNGFIPIQINHIDGNRKNNKRENLIILCPNCHSLTKHFMFYGMKHKKRYGKVRFLRCPQFDNF